MKKTILKKISPIILTLLLLAGLGAGFPIKSYAAGVSVYPSSDTVYVGDSVTVTVTIYGDEIYAYSAAQRFVRAVSRSVILTWAPVRKIAS